MEESTFKISACDVISADYTIIVLRSWVIMSSSRAIAGFHMTSLKFKLQNY